MARIPIISPEDAQGELSEIYRELREKRGGVAEVLAIQSLLPDSMRRHFDLYADLMFQSRETGLRRKLLEAIAVLVSACNRCDYCVAHHGEALSKLDREVNLEALKERDWPTLETHYEARDLAALRWAERMTLEPHLCDDAGAEALREAGLDDKQILQVTLVASYFNFVNRNVLALGVQLEEGFEKTCD